MSSRIKTKLKWLVALLAPLASVAGPVQAIGADALSGTVVVTASNTAENHLLVYDTTGALIQQVATGGQGGAGGNAGGIAVRGRTVAAVNFGSGSVSILNRGAAGFELTQVIDTVSPPVSVAFGNDHLYVLGATTVESHPIDGTGFASAPDGALPLLVADGSSAQVAVYGGSLIVTEKSGAIELVSLQSGAVAGLDGVALPDGSLTPFGLTTRGTKAYITFAGSDEVGLVRSGSPVAVAGTGFPGTERQHSPCWIAAVGPFLFSTNSPSHSLTRFVDTGGGIRLDAPVAAQTSGAPTDIAASADRIAVVDVAGGAAHLTQFSVGSDGELTLIVRTAIEAPANGVAFVS